MSATILDGRALATTLRGELAQEVAAFQERQGTTPTLAVVRAGEDPASVSYARAIAKTCEQVGVGFSAHILPAEADEAQIVALVADLSRAPTVHGIMIQEPLPKGVRPTAVLEALAPDKDVDGVHPVNAGRLAQAAPAGRGEEPEDYFVPATPAGGMEILKRYGVSLDGKHAVVVGRSNIVGKPMALLLLRQNATVTICHSRTADLAGVCRSADLLVAAVGRARMIKGDWVKPGAVVVDFGVNFEEGKMCGDVDFDEAVQVAGMITPVPGGTGPMTNVMLMRNVLEAARRQVGGR